MLELTKEGRRLVVRIIRPKVPKRFSFTFVLPGGNVCRVSVVHRRGTKVPLPAGLGLPAVYGRGNARQRRGQKLCGRRNGRAIHARFLASARL